MNGKTFLLALVALTLLRAAFVSFEEISANEAYYAVCARHPAPAYFDGPPGTMALAALGEAGAPDPVWRWWAPIWALLASLACYFLLRAMDTPGRAAWATLGLNALPVFNACAVRLRPELPALAFVLMGLGLAWMAMHAERGSGARWLGAAVAFALGAQFSYAVLCVIPGLALYTLSRGKFRRGPDGAGVAAIVLVPLLTLAPALAWNAYYEWVPVWSGTFRSLWDFSLVEMVISVARLFDKFSPLLLVVLLGVWIGALLGGRRQMTVRFVALCTLPAMILVAYCSLRGIDPVFFLLLAAPLLLWQMMVWLSRNALGRAFLQVAFALALIFSARSMHFAWTEGRGWRGVADELKNAFLEHTDAGHEGIFLIGGDAALASVLGYYLRDELVPPDGYPAVYERESQGISSQFGLWPGYDDFVETQRVVDENFTEQEGENPFIGRSAIYLSREPVEDVPQTIKAAFESVTFLKELPGAGADGQTLYLYFCQNYQTLPL